MRQRCYRRRSFVQLYYKFTHTYQKRKIDKYSVDFEDPRTTRMKGRGGRAGGRREKTKQDLFTHLCKIADKLEISTLDPCMCLATSPHHTGITHYLDTPNQKDSKARNYSKDRRHGLPTPWSGRGSSKWGWETAVMIVCLRRMGKKERERMSSSQVDDCNSTYG